MCALNHVGDLHEGSVFERGQVPAPVGSPNEQMVLYWSWVLPPSLFSPATVSFTYSCLALISHNPLNPTRKLPAWPQSASLQFMARGAAFVRASDAAVLGVLRELVFLFSFAVSVVGHCDSVHVRRQLCRASLRMIP